MEGSDCTLSFSTEKIWPQEQKIPEFFHFEEPGVSTLISTVTVSSSSKDFHIEIKSLSPSLRNAKNQAKVVTFNNNIRPCQKVATW